MGPEKEIPAPSDSGVDDLNVPNRVHVMPLGFEKERVYDAAKELNADHVILVVHETDNLDSSEYFNEVSKELEAAGIEIEVKACDLFDLYDSLSVIGEQISNNAEDQVFVNVATGSKVTAIAGMIACMAFDAVPYYVKGVGYEDDKTPVVDRYIQLPRYNIDAPEPEQIRLMEYIRDRMAEDEAPTKGDLIHEAEQQRLPFIVKHDVQEKGKYRLLDRAIIDPLSESGYIELEKSGRQKRVLLTEDGQDAVRAFESLV